MIASSTPLVAELASKSCVRFHKTELGAIYLGDSLDLMEQRIEDKSVNLIMTSPPFGLVRKKDYGNVDAQDYVSWFRPFAQHFKRILQDNGSFVLDIGGTWISGQPTRSLYHYELLIMLCKDFGFHLAQEFFWWNPARLPTPAEWVTVRRVRVKDAINCIWWLSPTAWPKASNKRVLQVYSESMKDLLVHGYTPKLRPSGHDISDKFSRDNGGSIPPNLLALAHTESNSAYIRYCEQVGINPHPARFPSEIPEFFIRMLTDVGDLVLDPFAGSCATAEAAERTQRRWLCCELEGTYVKGAVGRFLRRQMKQGTLALPALRGNKEEFYRAYRPGTLWNGTRGENLATDGGRTRPKKRKGAPKASARQISP
jgi:DNA modification methylase